LGLFLVGGEHLYALHGFGDARGYKEILGKKNMYSFFCRTHRNVVPVYFEPRYTLISWAAAQETIVYLYFS